MVKTRCTRCGACSEVCPIVEILPNRRLDDVFFDPNFDPWPCCSCYLCETVCPEGLSPREAMFEARRNLLADKNQLDALPSATEKLVQNMRRTGFVFPLDELTKETRSELDLPAFKSEEVDLSIKNLVRAIRDYEKKREVSEGGE